MNLHAADAALVTCQTKNPLPFSFPQTLNSQSFGGSPPSAFFPQILLLLLSPSKNYSSWRPSIFSRPAFHPHDPCDRKPATLPTLGSTDGPLSRGTALLLAPAIVVTVAVAGVPEAAVVGCDARRTAWLPTNHAKAMARTKSAVRSRFHSTYRGRQHLNH